MDKSFNQLTLNKEPRRKYKSIWLDTRDATISSDKKFYSFTKLPLIDVPDKSHIYLKSIDTVGGALAADREYAESISANMFFKLQGMKYNDESHVSSSNNIDITIYDGYQHLKNEGNDGRNCFLAELLKQDVNSIKLYIN